MARPDRIIVSDCDLEHAAWHRLVLTHPPRPGGYFPIKDCFDIYVDLGTLARLEQAIKDALRCTVTELAIPDGEIPPTPDIYAFLGAEGSDANV